ncbi:hypothetical protein AAKU55_000849 [Oxalobacteraceae bacterium GrIS 1.11]
MFRNHTLQRAIASIVLTTFTSLTLSPLMAAENAHDAMEKAGLLPQQKDEGFVGNAKRYLSKMAGAPVAKTSSADDRFSALLAEIHENLKAITPQTAMPEAARLRHGSKGWDDPSGSNASGAEGAMQTRAVGPDMRIEVARSKEPAPHALASADLAARVSAIRNKSDEIKQLYPAIEQSFKDTEQHLREAKLPAEILQRHAAAVAQYESRKAAFDGLMAKVEQASGNAADQQAALADLGGFMAKYPNAKPHQYTDPNKLPFGLSSGKVRAPNVSKEQYQASLFPPAYDKILLAGPIPDGLQFTQTALPATPNAADLAATDDVQLTQAIKDQAVALNKNPVAIYNWVRNNIQFIPSYGSIQGSEMTLQNKRGNAFDTASLLIALYRASGIPSRYVYGTIDVPADKVMNWVGGVSKAEAAQSLLGQGGIPNVALTAGGKISAIRMEHVWVQAYVDYTPSRGAVNKTPNTWVPMDASFKQYQFTQGMDIAGNVPMNAQTLLARISEGATINDAAGVFQNLNQGNMQNQLASYQAQVKTYIDSQKVNATIGDVFGTQKILQQSQGILLGTLPYKTIATGNAFQVLPDNLRWKFKTNLYAGGGLGDAGSPLIELNQSTAKLAGKKITLSFIPATQADQDLITSYMPRAHTDGTPIQPSEAPSSLPGYLVNMKAEFRVDGQVVAQSTASFTMGSELRQSNQYFNPANASWDGGADNDITVGEYNAIGIDLQGIGADQMANVRAKLIATKVKLAQFQQNPNDPTPIKDLTKEDLIGDFVHIGVMSYFAQVDANDRFAARAAKNVTVYRLPSYGRFFTAALTHYWFGVARNVSFPGVAMDVDYLFQHVEAKDGDRAKRSSFVRQIGSGASAAEHAVPESLFHNPNLSDSNPAQPQGISAVKALVLAAAQGQKIYTLNQTNQPMHGAILQSLQISEDVKLEITDALLAGQEVTVHERDITANGWTGSGYTSVDPLTGAGAYKIAGGNNGGFLKWVDSNSALLGLGAWALAIAGGAWLFLALAIVFAIVAAGIILFLEESDGSCGNGGLALYASIEILLGVLGFFAAPIYAWVFWVVGMQIDGGIRGALKHCGPP